MRDGTAKTTPALEAVFAATLRAVARYRPGRFGGAVTLLVPEIADPLRVDPEHIWRRCASSLTVHRVPGDHRGMIRGANAARAAAAFPR